MLLLAAASVCGGREGHPPIARVDLDPPGVPSGDGYATAVRLDGSRSCDEIDRPETCRHDAEVAAEGLRFAWEVEDAAVRLNHAGRAVAIAHLAGDRPVAIRLTVTDDEGLSASVRKMIRIELAAPP